MPVAGLPQTKKPRRSSRTDGGNHLNKKAFTAVKRLFHLKWLRAQE